MLKDAGLADSFWAEALFCFAYTWNRICHGNNNKTPFELYSGNTPSVKHLQPFGSKVYVNTPKQLRNKFQPRAKAGVMVGYAMRTRGYRVWLPEQRKVIETSNLKFSNEAVPVIENRRANRVYYESESDSEDDDSDDDRYTSPDTPEQTRFEPQPSTSRSPDLIIQPQPSSSRRPDTVDQTPQSSQSPDSSEVWQRKAVLRRDKSRYDIYYKPPGGKNVTLRSLNNVKDYCEKRKIKYDPKEFDFSTKNTYTGPITKKNISKPRNQSA